MARYRGGSIQSRPQASSAELIHLASDFIYDRKKVNLLSNLNQNTIELKEAVIINSAIELHGNEKLIEQQRNTNQLLDSINHLKSQELKLNQISNEILIEQQRNTNQLLRKINQLKSQELKLSKISNEIQKASFNQLLGISEHLRDMKLLEIEDRKYRVTLHEISLEIVRIHQIKEEFPEWSLLNLEILSEIIDENSMSIENFSTSFSDLSHAQEIFDNLDSLKNDLLALNKDD